MKIRFVFAVLLFCSFKLSSSPVVLTEPDCNSMSQSFTTYSSLKIRLLTEIDPGQVILTAISGKYRITDGISHSINIRDNESVIIARYGKRIFLKPRNQEGLLCDTIFLESEGETSCFSLRAVEGGLPAKVYSGGLKCFADMGKMLLINTCDIEKYLEGVVKAEGGGGKTKEYFKTQAIIARTYTYRYIGKHLSDGYNLCDDTHCQVYDGVVSDSLITEAVSDTRGQVITTPDSSLIISAFHSNCGGQTSPSEYVWVTGQPYFKRVVDQYCIKSKNASWEKKLALRQWTTMLQLNGFTGSLDDPTIFNFNQPARVADYSFGNFSMPLRTIRTRFDLKSSLFSVVTDNDSLILKGRGYGHGVGLCQEGAINMALEGFTCQQIINFYYFNVLIMDIKDVVVLPPNPL
jgi:stage II sporulation protein D